VKETHSGHTAWHLATLGGGKQCHKSHDPHAVLGQEGGFPGGLNSFRQPGGPQGTHDFASHFCKWFAFVEEPGG
jgi:hypothetical protein